MKSLEELVNVERGRLLHQLFPAEIPAFLQFVTGMSQTIEEERERIRVGWTDGLIAVDFWFGLAKQTAQAVADYGRQLHKSSRLFADELFNGYNALYLVHCLLQYTQTRKHTNAKFSMAVALLFT